jgi:hypothetical protein
LTHPGYTTGSLQERPNFGQSDAFLVKYSSTGARAWSRQFGTPFEDLAQAVAVDAHGSIYVSGYTNGILSSNTSRLGDRRGSCDLPKMPLPAQAHNCSLAPDFDMFLVKFDQMGNRKWAKQLGTAENDFTFGMSIASTPIDSSAVFITGYSQGTFDSTRTPCASTGCTDGILLKFSMDGTQIWARQVCSRTSCTSGYVLISCPLQFGSSASDSAYDVSTDSDGSAYVVGQTTGEFPGGGGSHDVPRLGVKKGDLFVAKFASNGSQIWARQYGTAFEDLCYNEAFMDGRCGVAVLPSSTGDHALYGT